MPDFAIAIFPEFSAPQTPLDRREFAKNGPSTQAFEPCDDLGNGVARREGAENMDMIRTDLQLLNGDVILFCNIGKELLDPSLYFALQYVSPVLGRPDHVVERIIDGMGGASENHGAIGLSLTCVWQRASSPLPNTLIPPRRKQRGSLNVFRAL